MSVAAFDAGSKLHQVLFESFKKELVTFSDTRDYFYCQYTDYIDELEIVAQNIAIEELGFDEDFDEYCFFAIQNPTPNNFTLIVALEFTDFETDRLDCVFIKLNGQILIENEKTVIYEIDHTSPDYSSNKEFEKARQLILK